MYMYVRTLVVIGYSVLTGCCVCQVSLVVCVCVCVDNNLLCPYLVVVSCEGVCVCVCVCVC